MLHLTNIQEVHKLVYTALSPDEGSRLKYCIKANGAVSIDTNQEPEFVVESTPSGMVDRDVCFVVDCVDLFTESHSLLVWLL